jgi:HAD superfamily phosphatase
MDFPFAVVLFDMDGVLVDVSRSYRRAIKETVDHFTGRKLSDGDVQRYKDLGGFNDDWKLTHAVITDTGISVPLSRVVEEFQDRYWGDDGNGFISQEPPLIEERTLATLNEGCDVMGVVTGRPENEAEWTLNERGWKKYFPLLVPKEKQEGREKPDPYPLQHALALLEAAGRPTSPDETVYIGDSVDDMQAARAADLGAVGMVPPYDAVDADDHAAMLDEHGAHVTCRDADELPDVLADLSEKSAFATD